MSRVPSPTAANARKREAELAAFNSIVALLRPFDEVARARIQRAAATVLDVEPFESIPAPRSSR
jgi:hypothetical protein